MAKSIFEILDTLSTETSVPAIGKNVEHTLPRKLFPTAEIFKDSSKLEAWAKENNCLHALLQAGLQKGLIDCRASFKACKKDATWTPEMGQKQVDAMSWEIVERPKVGNSGKAVSTARYNDCLGMIGNLASAGMDKSAIRKIVVPIYGDDMVAEVFAALEKASN